MSTTTPSTADQFLDLIVRSGLLSPEMLRPYAPRAKEMPDAQRALANQLVADRLLTSFQAGQLLAGKYRGFFLTDKYKVLGFIGTGGTGHVFLCEHLVLQRLVAVKLLHSSAAELSRGGQAAALDRFVREARAVATLDHPNIVRVYDMERFGAKPFMVMEYVDGTSLHQIVSQFGPQSIESAAYYTSQTAVGLQHAYEQGLMHRDIKPGNLLLDRAGVVKILDLGLARFLSDPTRNENLTHRYRDDAIVGTVDYMSPEQGMNNPDIDIRSDIYSLGATFYYLLSGVAPFGGESTVPQKLLAHQIREPVAIESLRSDIPEAMVAVLKQMMAKKPEDRYQTPAEVATALAIWTHVPLALPTAAAMPKLPPSYYRTGISPDPSGSVSKSSASTSSANQLEFPRTSSVKRDGEETPHEANQRTTRTSRGVPSLPAAPPPEPTEAVPSAVRRAVLAEVQGKARSQRPILLGAGVALVVLLIAGIWWASTQKTSGPAPNISPGPGPEGPPAPAVIITGGGSTFIRPAMQHWVTEYEKQTGVKIVYHGIGSGKGVTNFTDRVLDFGCTDAFMTADELGKARESNGEVLHIPLVMGAVVVTYALPDLDTDEPLQFTGPVLADIYLGKITKWNHESIRFCNPRLKDRLPDLKITPIHRSDKSGTTFIWTDYLSQSSPAEWDKVGVGTTPKWVVGQGAEKNDGVAAAVRKTPGAIGYVEQAYALENNMNVGSIKNDTRYVKPSLESVTAAANAKLQKIPADLRYSLTNAPGEDSYPIAGTTWALVYTNQRGAKGRELVKFLQWATHEQGQARLKDLRYAPLPPNLVIRIDEQLAKIRVTD